MTWTDNAKQTFEQAMKQFKGKHLNCALCGVVGEYDKDLEPLITNVNRFAIHQGNIFAYSVESSFACKDIDACMKRRRERKGAKR